MASRVRLLEKVPLREIYSGNQYRCVEITAWSAANATQRVYHWLGKTTNTNEFVAIPTRTHGNLTLASYVVSRAACTRGDRADER